ncbi:MAG: universal stress protein [Thermodesulfobacteriota bacterium]
MTGETDPRKILCALDFSEHTERTLATAIALAEKFGAALIFLHVLSQKAFDDLREWQGPAEALLGDEAEQAFIGLGEERAAGLKEFLSRARADLAPHQSIITRGQPHEEIIKAAESQGVDLIVMGIKGSGLGRQLGFGSQAEKVFHRAHCSVLFVR